LAEGLTDGGASAVLAASIFHFREYSVGEAKEHLRDAGLPVRPATDEWTERYATE
jgi:cyclase